MRLALVVELRRLRESVGLAGWVGGWGCSWSDLLGGESSRSVRGELLPVVGGGWGVARSDVGPAGGLRVSLMVVGAEVEGVEVD